MTRHVLIAAALAVMASAAAAADFSVKPLVTSLASRPESVLLVGNSLLYYNCGVNECLEGIARSKGVTLRATLASIGGAGLDLQDVSGYLERIRSAGNDKGAEKSSGQALGFSPFDAVVLEGPVRPLKAKLFPKYARIHSGAVRDYGAGLLFLAPWAHRRHPEMTGILMDTTARAANENRGMMVPVGLAFARSRAGRPDLRLTAGDGRHPSAAGTYLEAAVLFSVLTKSTPEGADYSGGCEKPMDRDDAAWLQRIAWETVRDYFGW